MLGGGSDFVNFLVSKIGKAEAYPPIAFLAESGDNSRDRMAGDLDHGRAVSSRDQESV